MKFFFRNNECIGWDYKNNKIILNVKNIQQIKLYEKKEIALLLVGEKINIAEKLYVYSFSGEERFNLFPPQGFSFSYLTNHPEVEIAIVCSSENSIEGWYDWHFSLDIKTGNLKRYCPAY